MIPEKYKNSILYFGDEGTRFMAALEMMHRLDRKIPVLMIKVNADEDRGRRIQSLLAVRKLDINWRVILMTGVPDEDIEALKKHALGIIYPDLYTVSFEYPISDDTHEATTFKFDDIEGIENTLRKIINGKQDI